MSDKQSLSLGKSKKVCGIEIKKMPIGAYLKAIEKIKEFPDELIGACFPGKTFEDVISELSQATETSFANMATNTLITAPKFFVSFMSELIDVDEDTLLSNADIGIDGLIEITETFIEVNKLGECLTRVGALIAKVNLIRKS